MTRYKMSQMLFFWGLLQTYLELVLVTDYLTKTALGSRTRIRASSYPGLGQPYPLPAMGSSDDVLSDDTTENQPVELQNRQPQIDESLDATSEEDSNSTETPSISMDLMKSVNEAIASQHKAFKKLNQEIDTLEKNLEAQKKKKQKEDVKNERSGTPDTLTLQLSFPSTRSQNEQVELAKVIPDSQNASTVSASKTPNLESRSTISLSNTLLPIPVLHIREDAESKLAQFLRNAQDMAQQEVLFDEKELENMAEMFPDLLSAEIEESQRLTDKLHAAITYLKSDSELASKWIASHMEQPSTTTPTPSSTRPLRPHAAEPHPYPMTQH